VQRLDAPNAARIYGTVAGLEIDRVHGTSPDCCGRITARIASGIYVVAAACAAEVKAHRGGFGGYKGRGAAETAVNSSSGCVSGTLNSRCRVKIGKHWARARNFDHGAGGGRIDVDISWSLAGDHVVRLSRVEIQINEAEGSVWTRILRAEHLVAICLRVGRPKDLIRITQFLEGDALDLPVLCEILWRHNLRQAWKAFCGRAGIADPCDIQREP